MARSFCRTAFLVVLTLLLAAPWSAAEPRTGGAPSPRLLDQAWTWLTALWGDIGCGIDPSRLCRPATDSLEIGCGIDPDGRCRNSSEEQGQRDIGCLIDPNGGCGQ